MSRIREAFANGKAFIPFITAGDPDTETTAAVVRAAVRAGADLVELGIPFSDPTAEGPVIQEANLRALTGGVTTDKIFDLVRDREQKMRLPDARGAVDQQRVVVPARMIGDVKRRGMGEGV